MIFDETQKNDKRIRTSDSIANIAKALSQVQAEIVNPANSAVNPFYKSKYAPLPDVLKIVRPLLGKYGLAAIQTPYNKDDKVFISTLIIHESGEWIESDPLELKPEKNTPQGIGSAITYGRRYAISSILGISSEEDDDGNSNEPKAPKTSAQTKGKKETTQTTEDETDFTETKKKIMTEARKKSAMSDDIKAIVKEILARYHSSGNPNKIEDLGNALKCLEEINNIKVEDK